MGQIEIDITQVIEVVEINVSTGENSGGGVTLPISISDVTNLQDELDAKLESPIAISDVSGLSTELAGKAPITITYGRTISAATTLAATDLYKAIEFNSVADIDVAIGTDVPVGAWFHGMIIGAGIPNFTLGANQAINTVDLTGRTDFTFQRKNDIGGVQQYYVI
jgi:hypothetical protein